MHVLTHYRRFQRLLLFGGGLFTTLMVLLTFSLGVHDRLRTHLEVLRQVFIVNSNLLATQDMSVLVTPFNFYGMCSTVLILSRNGDVLVSATSPCDDTRALEPGYLHDLADNTHLPLQEQYGDGVFSLTGVVAGRDWVLVHTYSSRNIGSIIGRQVGVEGVLTMTILMLMWLLLISLKLQVFRPLLEWAQCVHESEKLNRTLIDTVPVGLGLIAIDGGEVLLCSPTMLETGERLAPVSATLSAAFVKRYDELMLEPGKQPEAFHEELSFTLRDNSRLDLSVRMARARHKGRDVLVAAFADVTAKIRVAEQMREARQLADSANAAKSAFLAAMSHEIRTPLNAILGNLELLSHSALDCVQRDRLNVIRASSDGLLATISDVLDLSKIEAGELRLEHIEFDALEVVSSALMMFAPAASAKGLRLMGELGHASTQPMRGDPTRLGQVIYNLLSNAIKFTESGQVLLRMLTDEARSQLVIEVQDTGIGLSSEQLARMFQAFSQADASINRRFGGTGLGLALCSRLVQAMGGTLSVASELGQGSRFILSLPLGACTQVPLVPRFNGQHVLLVVASHSACSYVCGVLRAWGLHVTCYSHPSQVGSAAISTASILILWGERRIWDAAEENRLVEESLWVIDCAFDGTREPLTAGRLLSVSMFVLRGLAAGLRHALQGKALATPQNGRKVLVKPLRVLVVEDNALNRELFREQLKLLGCAPLVVANGEQALTWLEDQPFDALLTDLSMPVLDGYELARQASQRWPDMPVLAVTAHVTLQERLRCEKAGMLRVLGKPLSLNALGEVLSEVTGTECTYYEAGQGSGLLGGQVLPDSIREMFWESCETSLTVLRQARRDGDVQQMLAELHSLRGMLGVYRMRGVSRQLIDAEERLKCGTFSALAEVDKLMIALEAEINLAHTTAIV
jgi:two-component system capsular synthesis sensor histidine kinase RcsC